MKRREFITWLGGMATPALFGAPAVLAQQAASRRLVGIVMPYAETDVEYRAHVDMLRDELKNRGWVEGRNIYFDEHWTTDNMDHVRADTATLVASKPDVIVAIGGRVVPIIMKLSSSIPIVVPGAADPVGIGWVQSMARPGGNVTGFSFFELSILGKMLEILRQIAPTMRRIAMLYNPDNPSTNTFRPSFEGFARQLSIEPVTIAVHNLGEIDRTLASLAEQQGTGIFIPPDITLNALRDDLVALVAQRHMPAIYPQSAFVRSGGLAFYGADRLDLWRRGAEYVDRILRGEKPGDLRFQQPTKYQLLINLKTAKALGLEVPVALLASADEVIE
jgi:putative ABC transport system substrate-binding protein